MSDALALSMPLFDLRAPKFLSAAQRNKLPVSFDVGPDGKPVVLSYMVDHVWQFHPYVTADSCRRMSSIGHFASVAFASADDPFDPAGNYVVPLYRGHGVHIRYTGLE